MSAVFKSNQYSCSLSLLLEAPMTVKDVLQSLVDDNLVDCERVGTSNYYWSFPSKALNARKNKLEELQKQVMQQILCIFFDNYGAETGQDLVWYVVLLTATVPVFELHPVFTQNSEAAQRQATLEMSIETAKVGRQDTVRMIFPRSPHHTQKPNVFSN